MGFTVVLDKVDSFVIHAADYCVVDSLLVWSRVALILREIVRICSVQLSQLSSSESKVADVIGVSEGYVAKMASGRVSRLVCHPADITVC